MADTAAIISDGVRGVEWVSKGMLGLGGGRRDDHDAPFRGARGRSSENRQKKMTAHSGSAGICQRRVVPR